MARSPVARVGILGPRVPRICHRNRRSQGTLARAAKAPAATAALRCPRKPVQAAGSRLPEEEPRGSLSPSATAAEAYAKRSALPT